MPARKTSTLGADIGAKRSFAMMSENEATNSSGKSTSRGSPARSNPNQTNDCLRNFDSRASIVLVGMPGVGKATLAMMAAPACRRRVADLDALFRQATGVSMAVYHKNFGASKRSLCHEEVLRKILQTFDQDAIIVCNGGFRLDMQSQNLLHEFARTHPVIHIMRDPLNLYNYLEAAEEAKLRQVIAMSTSIFRRCSNYEFYNVDEMKVNLNLKTISQTPTVPAFLSLKRAERTFFKFLSLIFSSRNTHGQNERANPPMEPSHFPLSHIATELRNYTCAVQVHYSDILSRGVDIEELEFGCDAIEIVIDPEELTSIRADDITKSIFTVRRSTVIPVIFHTLPAATDAKYNRANYLANVFHGIRLAPEYATVDLSMDEDTILSVISCAGSTKLIGHLHAARDWYDSFWVEKYDMAMHLGCSLVRFTRPAQFMDDNAAIQSFRNTVRAKPRKKPLICYNTGRAGRRSACFNQVLTSVIPEKFVQDREGFEERVKRNPETAWLTVQEATHILYASFTYDPMKFCIIGATAGYSMSPAMHNAAYIKCGMPHHFDRIQSEDLKRSLADIVSKPNFGGTAISQPFKIEAMKYAHSTSRHAQAIGAINTLIPVRHLNEDGSVPSADDVELFQERNQSGPVKTLYGDNTDWIGIRSCIRRGLSAANAVRSTTCGLIIGSGGMARAAVYALLQLGVKNIVLFNRTVDNARKIVAHFAQLTSDPSAAKLFPSFVQASHPTFHILRSRDDSWPESLHAPTIIASCIPTHSIAGVPSPDFTLPTAWMQSPTGGVVIELAYRTLDTPLMRQVREQASASWICMDGLDLLPEQGFAQFELFTGKRAPRRIMREEVLRCWANEHGQANAVLVQSRLEALTGQEP